MRNFMVVNTKTGEVIARSGSLKTATRFANKQKDEHKVIKRGGANGTKRVL